ncbi:hypothetical protein ABPG75_008364 [Micractinium tetrahymenae]
MPTCSAGLVTLLAAALLAGCGACAATTGGALSPDDTYTVETASGAVVLAPSAAWNASAILLLQGLEVAGCADACRADTRCMLFNHCNVPGGCNSTVNALRYQDCQLLAAPCTAVPVAEAAGPWVERTAGFPVRYQAPQTPGFVARQAEGVAGNDMQCDGSVLPGRCAFASVDAAVQTCSTAADCDSVVIYYRGLDGCSNLTAVLLATDVSSSAAAFVSPTVASLTKEEDGSDGGSGGGLSGGAIAGIAAGAAAGAAVAAGLVWALLRRCGGPAGRAQRTAPIPGAATESAKLSSALTCSSGNQAGTGSTEACRLFGSSSAQACACMGSSRGGTGGTGASSSSGTATGGTGELGELARHIAACEARSMGGASSMEREQHGTLQVLQPPLLSIGSLPASLRDWVVDLSEVTFMQRPDGSLVKLGWGASGTVFRAEFRGEPVAAKEVQLGHSAAAQEAFVLEAERLHQLRHAHVVTLYGVALSGPIGVLLMEYCGGRDLMQALELKVAGSGQRVFSWHNRGRRIAYDVAKALNFLHARGIVHLDVKSSNILLTASGAAKLGDVGLARMLHSTYLSELPLVGTFAWVAPEVLMGGQCCTSAVDLYSFGVVLWELITGEKPTRGRLRAPRVPEECPQEVADLMMECMRLDPSQRPTAQQVMQRLRGMHGPKGEG